MVIYSFESFCWFRHVSLRLESRFEPLNRVSHLNDTGARFLLACHFYSKLLLNCCWTKPSFDCMTKARGQARSSSVSPNTTSSPTTTENCWSSPEFVLARHTLIMPDAQLGESHGLGVNDRFAAAWTKTVETLVVDHATCFNITQRKQAKGIEMEMEIEIEIDR